MQPCRVKHHVYREGTSAVLESTSIFTQHNSDTYNHNPPFSEARTSTTIRATAIRPWHPLSLYIYHPTDLTAPIMHRCKANGVSEEAQPQKTTREPTPPQPEPQLRV